MAEEESFENLDDLDWSDVESELKANRDQILSEVKSEGEVEKQAGREVDSSIEAEDEIGSSNSHTVAGDMDINFLFDVQLSIIVEVGRVEMLISDLLELEEESIIELDSMVGLSLIHI